jgi:hypothetical protein
MYDITRKLCQILTQRNTSSFNYVSELVYIVRRSPELMSLEECSLSAVDVCMGTKVMKSAQTEN